jgi:hypothetical protein
MTPGGWTTLIASTVAVWGLAIWCYYRVLTAPPEEGIQEPPDSLGG